MEGTSEQLQHQRSVSGATGPNANPLGGRVDAVEIYDADAFPHSLQFHFTFFFNLITVVYFKAQTVKVDLGTLAEAGERWRHSANVHPEMMQVLWRK